MLFFSYQKIGGIAIEYRYPKLQNSLTFRETDTGTVEVIDVLTERRVTLSMEEAAFAQKLNGHTHPYRIPTRFTRERIDTLLEELDTKKLLHNSDTRILPYGTILHTMWEPQNESALLQAGNIWNKLLFILFFPTLLLGIILFLFRFREFGFAGMLWGAPVGFVSGLILHELSHLFAAAAYGAKIREIGIMLLHIIIPGIYTVMDDEQVKNRVQRIQIHAAGTEMNLLLTGLYLILGSVITKAGGIFLMAAGINAAIAVMNLTLIRSSDGASILAEALGTNNIMKRAEQVVKKKSLRQRMINQGEAGLITIIMYYILYATQILLPILLLTNILEVILWLI